MAPNTGMETYLTPRYIEHSEILVGLYPDSDPIISKIKPLLHRLSGMIALANEDVQPPRLHAEYWAVNDAVETLRSEADAQIARFFPAEPL